MIASNAMTKNFSRISPRWGTAIVASKIVGNRSNHLLAENSAFLHLYHWKESFCSGKTLESYYNVISLNCGRHFKQSRITPSSRVSITVHMPSGLKVNTTWKPRDVTYLYVTEGRKLCAAFSVQGWGARPCAGLSSGGSRISPGGAPTPQEGAQIYNFAKFSQKLHEIERIWMAGGGVCPSHHPSPKSATVRFTES